MKLEALYDHLLTRATRSGQDQGADLPGGARLAVRVKDRVVTLSIARKDKPVGDRELITFRACCQVPAGATRLPAEGQERLTRDGATWHRVAFRWEEAA